MRLGKLLVVGKGFLGDKLVCLCCHAYVTAQILHIFCLSRIHFLWCASCGPGGKDPEPRCLKRNLRVLVLTTAATFQADVISSPPLPSQNFGQHLSSKSERNSTVSQRAWLFRGRKEIHLVQPVCQTLPSGHYYLVGRLKHNHGEIVAAVADGSCAAVIQPRNVPL